MNIFSSSQGRENHTRRSTRRSVPGQSPRRPLPSAVTESASTEGKITSALTAALFALPITIVIGVILLLIVTAVAYGNPDPDALTTPLALGSLGLTALLGGLVSARRGGTRPLLCGLLLGLLLTLLLLGASLLLHDTTKAQLTLGFSPTVLWVLHGGVVLLGMLGGKLGSTRVSKNRNHHARR